MRSRAAFLPVVLLMLAGTQHVIGQNYRIEQIVFLPPVYYVGDIVEARLSIRTDGSIPSEPQLTPETEWLLIHEIRVIPIADRYDIRIRFTSFKPGFTELQGIDLGEVTIDSISIETASMRNDGEEMFRDILDPVFLPGTRLLIGIVAGVVLFGPLLLLLFVGWLRRTITRLAGSIGIRRPYRALLRKLDALHAAATQIDAREFYHALLESFRVYLSDRSERNYAAATTSEMDRFARAEFEGVEALDVLSDMVGTMDAAKFGGGVISPAEKLKGLELIRTAAVEIERRKRTSQ